MEKFEEKEKEEFVRKEEEKKKKIDIQLSEEEKEIIKKVGQTVEEMKELEDICVVAEKGRKKLKEKKEAKEPEKEVQKEAQLSPEDEEGYNFEKMVKELQEFLKTKTN